MRFAVLALILYASVSASLANAAEDRSIWLQAGQCVVVGGQQVCAQKAPEGTTVGCPSTTPTLPNKITHQCKNGIKHESDPNLKGWAHVIITRSPDGKKLSEEVEKTYGPLGKKLCLTDVEKAKLGN
jgi:hypothetical protein